jgi:PmbA protein
MQRDYWYTVARRADDLESPAAVGRRAAERTLRRMGARRIATRAVPVIFVAELARGFLGHMVSAIKGAAQYRKASFLLGAAGSQVLPAWFGIEERPHLPRGPGSAPFDAEGVATHDRSLVAAACCRAMCCRVTRRGGSACRPPAMPAASTTCW